MRIPNNSSDKNAKTDNSSLGYVALTVTDTTIANALNELCEIPPPEDLKEVLWTRSLTQNVLITTLRLLQAGMFISNNVAVNWYSLCKNWSRHLSSDALLTLNLIFSWGTIVSNAFSKVTDLGDKIQGLNLDEN